MSQPEPTGGHLFTEAEAWSLFRIAAFGEAIGWTLLISGILINKYLTPHSYLPVQIAGKFHGTLFVIYLVGVIVIWPSLKKSKLMLVVAVAASVPPYGTLALEQWWAWQRRRQMSASRKLK
ncbi:DUF3817 domain-containing protein [Candidatus Saccharibacteria bacterium]|nr:DUF3817 domain-containing protein [Candidatus Saccharibacteria bacterium]